VPLRLVPSRKGQPGRIRQLLANRRRVLNIASVSIVAASLLAVVVAQALLANGQVRLSSLQNQLSLEQSAHRQAELAVSELETPPRIVSSATSQGMVRPANVVELPYVSLSVPVPTPNVTPAPAPPPAPAGATTTASGGTTSGTAATGGTTGNGATSSTTTATSTP